jgi:hypothetical protein
MVKYFNMEYTKQLTQTMNEIKTVAHNDSWFRGTPYYWAEASLPFAYALACVEVVCKGSESELYSMRARLDSTNITQGKTVPEMPFSLLG